MREYYYFIFRFLLFIFFFVFHNFQHKIIHSFPLARRHKQEVVAKRKREREREELKSKI